ncbi:choline-sulfatase [Halobacillus dabanensis]|uniref:Choline-sulfatase n=1 Tax=Halobacillus dabanensis TaxID=240302 RepID=A0A1I3RZW7_HALDA|nr:choline-sulfatase [Halobacillus dabanensis]SFJ51600.1 choline-sulfatase [Halobacillus dabanensis]
MQPQGEKNPNIVLIMADQLAPDVISALGHPSVQTPNIDKLVEKGVTFDNAYCNSPICAPSRASFISGQHVSSIDVFDNGSEFSSDTPTFLHHLRKSGYETVLAGKMHFIGPDQFHGFEKRITDEIHTPDFDLTPDWSKGVYHNPGTGVKRLKKAGVEELNNNIDYDEKVIHRTLEQIRTFKRTEDQRPFFLCSSFFHPHDPFVITEEYWNRYEGCDIPMPAVPEEAPEDMHPFNLWIQKHHERDICELTEEEIYNNRRAYYGMVTYFDHKVGQIIHELERLDMMDNTIIMVTSDHGEMLGEHGMWFKRTFYDPAAKVPLVISKPDQFLQNQRASQVVSLVDLAATILDLADVEDKEGLTAEMDGDSFASMLREEEIKDWKNEAICEYYGEGPVKPMIMIRKDSYKYVEVLDEAPLLFDVEADPLEINNLSEQEEFQPLIDIFQQRIEKQFDLESIHRKILKNQKNRLFIADALNTGYKTSWDHNTKD